MLAFDSSGHRGRTGTHSFQRAAGRDAPITAHTRAAFGLAQAGFEQNVGQTDARVKFLARGNGYSLFLTDTEAVFSLTDLTEQPTRSASAQRTAGRAWASPASILRMKLLGAQSPAKITGLDRRRGTRNYFSGSDRSHWWTDIPAYGSVRYTNVYPGIDLLYHDNQRELEYDFIVAPGASPDRIALRFEGASAIRVNRSITVSISCRSRRASAFVMPQL